MRKAILHITSWIHSVMLLNIPILIVFVFLHEGTDALACSLYLKGCLILLPVAVTDIAVLKCRTFGSFALINCAVLVLTFGLAFAVCLLSDPEIYAWVQCIIIILETIILFISRMYFRVQYNRYLRDANSDAPGELEKPSSPIWDRPSFRMLIVFSLLYCLGLNTASPVICSIGFWSTIFYLFMTILHHFIESSEKYLGLNRDIYGVPAHRIYVIGGIMTALLSAVLLIMCIPSIAAAGARQYRNIRDASFGSPVGYDELMAMQNSENTANSDFNMDDLLGEDAEIKSLPAWVNNIVYVIGAVILAAVIYFLIMQIRQALKDFQHQTENSADVIEAIAPEESIRKLRRHPGEKDLSYREQIRRKYRKMIRKHRKEKPFPSETPTEIEAEAGLTSDPQMQELHKLYESVRYGKES